MATSTLQLAKKLYSYLSMRSYFMEDIDLIVVCCSYDLRVCDYACHIFNKKLPKAMIFSGLTGNWTKHLWDEPEAVVFANRAKELGVSKEKIFIEDKATNTAENIFFSREMFPDANNVLFISKSNSLRRIYRTIPIQWQGINFYTDAPSLDYPNDASKMVGVLGLIDEMVGDIHRLIVYSEKGFQTNESIPGDIIEAWESLIKRGFDRHLVK
ncbi:YdcF family protein [Vreelandella alkaliphila]|uniref:YdcF family protein n=1 Tax=Vreelandella alkaliphila TaxID=272774 RepID=UPI003FD73DC5